MKSSYELAMERLNKTAPTTKLTAQQKKQIAELESEYTAKIAGREIALQSEMLKQPDQAESLSQQLAIDRKKLQGELEDKKARVRVGN